MEEILGALVEGAAEVIAEWTPEVLEGLGEFVSILPLGIEFPWEKDKK